MQKLLLKLCPLLLFLLIFSCAKDNEIAPIEKGVEMNQALTDDKGGPCNVPCRQPDFLNVTDITVCSAEVTWGFELPDCGTFNVELYNHDTGTSTYLYSVDSPLSLSDLDNCTRYTIGVSHVTRLCVAAPLTFTFETPCKGKCPTECEIPCKAPDYVSVTTITETGATINFGHYSETCGFFIVQLRNNVTGVYTTYNPAVNPLVLSNLDPCTSYTVGISHVTDFVACAPTQITFMTECEATEPCDATGLDPASAWINQFGFDIPGVIDINDNEIRHLNSNAGYLNFSDPILTLKPNTDYRIGVCYLVEPEPVDGYIKMWLDLNKDYEFTSDELVFDFHDPEMGDLCLNFQAPLVIPDAGICGINGRIILSVEDGPITSPCGEFPQGQVTDFLVNIGECGD